MASIRRLKKDIDYLTFAVIDDSLNCLAYGQSTDNVADVVEGVINKRNDLRRRVNEGKSVAKGERKAYYKGICKDLMESVDQSFTQLSELVKQKG